MQRRDFLKYFGVGASVVPLIGGLPQSDVVAKLIEEPKADVKLVPQMPHRQMLDLLGSWDKFHMQVNFVTDDGRALSFRCQTFIAKWALGPADVSVFDNVYLDRFQPYSGVKWQLEGEVVNQPVLHESRE
jgi:hypothetical protein